MTWDIRSVEGSLYLIPLLPLVSAVFLRLFGRALGKPNVSLVACASVAGSFAVSLIILVPMSLPSATFLGQNVPASIGRDHGVWFQVGEVVGARLSLYVDHLGALMLAVVSGVSFVIHVYSVEYMKDDEGFHRYFAYLNLFVAFMLLLVLANNLVLMFVGWEGVGLCSYLLIGFWFEDDQKAYAGRKAFVVNRIGDFGFLLGVFVLFAVFGTTEINSLSPGEGPSMLGLARSLQLDAPIASGPLATLRLDYGQALTLACLLLFLGVMGKSAQIPLYVWLPDAMAGPTPVSALIHAATMVTAGVYLIARLSLFYALSPAAMFTVTCLGAATALFAALLAFAQNDIKKVLAYSTVSQLGFMVFGVGLGAFWQSMFHLVTHAFFKALLFLAAGSVIMGCHHEQDIRKMGGLRKRMPWTWATFLVGVLAITGVVPLAGFFSKDELLHFVEGARIAGYPHVGHVVYIVGSVAAFCTAFYMFRLYYLVFEGGPRVEETAHAQESGTAVRFALVTLAVCSVLGILLGVPLIRLPSGWQIPFEFFTLPSFVPADIRLRIMPGHYEGLVTSFAIALVIAWAGLGLAWLLYRKDLVDKVGAFLKPGNFLYDLFANKFYVDEAYDLVVVLPFKALAFVLWEVVDVFAIDTVAVRGTALLATSLGKLLRLLQNGDLQRYAAVIALAVVAIVWALSV